MWLHLNTRAKPYANRKLDSLNGLGEQTVSIFGQSSVDSRRTCRKALGGGRKISTPTSTVSKSERSANSSNYGASRVIRYQRIAIRIR